LNRNRISLYLCFGIVELLCVFLLCHFDCFVAKKTKYRDHYEKDDSSGDIESVKEVWIELKHLKAIKDKRRCIFYIIPVAILAVKNKSHPTISNESPLEQCFIGYLSHQHKFYS
jgi:hypothetical protein